MYEMGIFVEVMSVMDLITRIPSKKKIHIGLSTMEDLLLGNSKKFERYFSKKVETLIYTSLVL